MLLKYQQPALNELELYAKADKHNILIEGLSGSGKSYAAKQYANMLGIDTTVVIDPTVSDIRHAIDECYKLSERVVVIVRDIDGGAVKASYTLLKFLEEPPANVYLIITCSDLQGVPSTILSRSIVVHMNHPDKSAIKEYAYKVNASTYEYIQDKHIWKLAVTLTDVDELLGLSQGQVEYFEHIRNKLTFKDSVSALMWEFTHYPDDSSIDPNLLVRFIMAVADSRYLKDVCRECSRDIKNGRIAAHAVIGKLILEGKYGGY